MKMKAEEKQLDLDQAVTIAAEQRNRLLTIHGTSPAAIVFGAVPSQQGLSDEPWCIAGSDAADQQEVVRLRVLTATAFHQANNDRTPPFWPRGEPTSPSARTSTTSAARRLTTQLRSTCTLAAVLGNPFGTGVLRTGQLGGRRRANAYAGGLLQPMKPQFKCDELKT